MKTSLMFFSKMIIVFLIFLTSFIVQANSSMLRCQTKIIKPGMTIEEVKSLCGEPREESEETESLVCYNKQNSVSICNKIKLKHLVYKRPTHFQVDFQNNIVSNVDMRIPEFE